MSDWMVVYEGGAEFPQEENGVRHKLVEIDWPRVEWFCFGPLAFRWSDEMAFGSIVYKTHMVQGTDVVERMPMLNLKQEGVDRWYSLTPKGVMVSPQRP